MHQAFTGRINNMFDSWWYHFDNQRVTSECSSLFYCFYPLFQRLFKRFV